MDLDKQKLVLELLVGVKACKQSGAIWMTCNPELHKLAEDYIQRGWLMEITIKGAQIMDLSMKDRCFEITDKGIEETSWLTVE